MKVYYKYLFFLFLLLMPITCKDHIRNNQFDIGADGFEPLPPGYVYIYDVEWDSISGRVYSIVFAIWFPDTLTRGYYLYHTISLNDTVVWTYSGMIEAGTKIYGFRMYYGYYWPWPDGEYCFSVYWGEIGVGAIPFLISSEGKKSRVNGLIDLRLEYMKPEIPMDTIRLEF